MTAEILQSICQIKCKSQIDRLDRNRMQTSKWVDRRDSFKKKKDRWNLIQHGRDNQGKYLLNKIIKVVQTKETSCERLS